MGVRKTAKPVLLGVGHRVSSQWRNECRVKGLELVSRSSYSIARQVLPCRWSNCKWREVQV